MDQKICDYLNGLKDGSFALCRGELMTFVDGLKNETDDFSKDQRATLEKLLFQLSTQQITKQQFEDAIADMKTELQAEITLNKVKTKAAAQRISEGVTKLVINGLIKAIPG
jgi:Glu-tRNA(Gln) amidotransferase subunit E-like FAD-binding protein